MSAKKLAVAAIKKGTVIDHITAGQALRIVKLLNLAKHHKQVALGLNLPSKTLKYKDLIKVEDRELSADEVNQVAILSPHATINIIQNFEVVKKFQVSIPQTLSGILACPNPKCVTNHEKMVSSFIVKQRVHKNVLHCRYCHKTFQDAG